MASESRRKPLTKNMILTGPNKPSEEPPSYRTTPLLIEFVWLVLVSFGDDGIEIHDKPWRNKK